VEVHVHDVMERGVADDLGGLLARSASGDVEAFARFYDATSAQAYTLAVARCRARGLKAAAVRRDAAAEVERRFLLAWRLAAQQPASSCSPLAWLLGLDAAPATMAGTGRG
jgi:RNA polymerase sigma-70 factor (ECF subfamily)